MTQTLPLPLMPKKTCIAVGFTKVNLEDKGSMVGLVHSIETNYKDRYDEICSHWGSKALGPKICGSHCQVDKGKCQRTVLQIVLNVHC